MKIVKIWLTDTAVWIRTDDGREACEEFSKYHRLRAASQEQRLTYRQSEEGLHWDELGEDLSFEVFFDTKPTTALYNFFMHHPELNASAIARRLGMSQSLFAHYISGAKTPSSARMKEILQTIATIGSEVKMSPKVFPKIIFSTESDIGSHQGKSSNYCNNDYFSSQRYILSDFSLSLSIILIIFAQKV